jgi:hypothetical protein
MNTVAPLGEELEIRQRNKGLVLLSFNYSTIAKQLLQASSPPAGKNN